MENREENRRKGNIIGGAGQETNIQRKGSSEREQKNHR